MQAFRALCALVLAAAASFAHAEVFDLPGTFAPAVSYGDPLAAGPAFWIEARQPEANSRAIRYAAAGSSAVEFPLQRGQVIATGTDDGGVVLFDRYGANCTFERRDAEFALRWRVRIAGTTCLEVTASGDNVWALVGSRVHRISADGSIWREPPESFQYRWLRPAPGGDVFAISLGSASDPFVRVARIATGGTIRWQSAATPMTGSLAVAQRDDAIVVASSEATQAGRSYTITALRVIDGTIQYSRTLAGAVGVLSAGSLRDWFVESADGRTRVHSFARDGSDAIANYLPEMDCPGGRCAVLPLADGSALAFGTQASVGPTAMRVAGDGVTAVPAAAPIQPNRTARLADGTHVLAATDSFGRAIALFKLHPDATFEPLALPPEPIAATRVSAAAFGADGSLTMLRADDAHQRAAWSFHDARGALRWSNRFDFEVAEFGASVTDESVCASWNFVPGGDGFFVACRDAASGTLRWQRLVSGITPIPFVPLVRQFSDGSVLTAARNDAGSPRGVVVRFDANGSELSRIETTLRPLALTAAGMILAADESQILRVIRPDGSVVATLESDGIVLVGDDRGDAFATVRFLGADRVRVRQYDALGALRSESFADGVAQFAQFVAGSEGVLIVAPRLTGAGPLQVRFMPSDGTAGWQREFPALGTANARVLRGGDVAVLSVGGDRLRVHVVSGRDGSDRLLTDEGCRLCGALLFPSSLADGFVRAVSTSSGPGGVERSRLLAIPAVETRIAPDARSFSGAWFPSYLAGEGLVATADPASNSLFAAWFTYATPFVEAEPGLRWYSLQGPADPSGVSTLTIYENRGGAFAQPPATSAVPIGTATLRLVDCNRAELEYEFNGAPGRGRRTLSRLTNPARCGTTPPAPRAGLDWRQSGGWFNAATAGQGVLFSIAPDAPVFGAWFTYDVAGRDDDAAKQQWLTLQSAGVPASGTDIALDVYRTIGGEFDVAPAASTTRIGSATLSLDGCSRATLRWQFDSSAAAGMLSGLSGQQQLERLGACPP